MLLQLILTMDICLVLAITAFVVFIVVQHTNMEWECMCDSLKLLPLPACLTDRCGPHKYPTKYQKNLFAKRKLNFLFVS